MTIEWDRAKQVLIAAHLPDVKFEAHMSASSVDALPVSSLILELRRCLWDTKHVDEYADFLRMIAYPCDERRQAVSIGLQRPEIGYGRLMVAIRGKRTRPNHKVKNIKRHIEETLITDGVNAMPGWLYSQCDEIFELNLKGHGDLW
jgi:hypothetical protein